MPTTATPSRSAVIAIARGTSNPAAGVTRSAAIPAGLGGTVLSRATNGGTGPTTAGQVNVYACAPTDGNAPAVPSSGSMGPDWFLIGSAFGGSLTANDARDLQPVQVRETLGYIVTEAAGNTGQAVSFEVRYARLDSITAT